MNPADQRWVFWPLLPLSYQLQEPVLGHVPELSLEFCAIGMVGLQLGPLSPQLHQPLRVLNSPFAGQLLCPKVHNTIVTGGVKLPAKTDLLAAVDVAFSISCGLWRGCRGRHEGPAIRGPVFGISVAIAYLSHWFVVIRVCANGVALSRSGRKPATAANSSRERLNLPR